MPSSKEEGGEKGEADGVTKKEKSKEDERLIITHIPVLPPRYNIRRNDL